MEDTQAHRDSREWRERVLPSPQSGSPLGFVHEREIDRLLDVTAARRSDQINFSRSLDTGRSVKSGSPA